MRVSTAPHPSQALTDAHGQPVYACAAYGLMIPQWHEQGNVTGAPQTPERWGEGKESPFQGEYVVGKGPNPILTP